MNNSISIQDDKIDPCCMILLQHKFMRNTDASAKSIVHYWNALAKDLQEATGTPRNRNCASPRSLFATLCDSFI